MASENSSRQDLTMEEGHKKKTSGWFVKPATALFLVALAVAAVVAVGLIVWFAAPREKCPRLDKDAQKGVCKKYMDSHGYESLCSGATKAGDNKGKGDSSKEEDKTAKKQLAAGVKLNGTYIPSHYTLELWPRLYYGDDYGFNGTVDIFMSIAKETDVIILHIADLTVHNTTIELRNVTANVNILLPVNRTEEDTSRQFYKIYTDRKLGAGEFYKIKMSFNGTLIHTDWRGMYRSSYKENNQTKWLVSTQFETTYARRAFPCFDEPALKATFDVTLVRRSNFSSISNMPISITRDRGDGWMADIYQTTVTMPTYLLAFVVSQFIYVEDTTRSGLKMRVWTRPSFIQYAAYANSISLDIIEAFEDWTGIGYALPKMDQIAVPDFAAGAMENWGLVTYRETALLYNPDFTSMTEKRYAASVIAHEIAHQWFGNLVTCDWWDNIFLNEAFATYFGDLVGLNNVETTWKMDEFFLRRVQYIMDIDEKHNSQGVYVTDVDHHDNHRKAFHRITYYKGGSILRMLKYFLTEATFKQAIRNYLNKYSFKTATKEQLYEELQKQAEQDGRVTWDASKVNISQILDTWIVQMNFPLVTVTDLRTGTLRLEQSHFLLDKTQNVSQPSYLGDFKWDIPLTYTTKSSIRNREPATLKWDLRQPSIEINGLNPTDWKLVNLYTQGFYRVRYDLGTWGALVEQLKTDHSLIPVENRAQLLDDAFHLAEAGEFSDLEALRATQYITKEVEYLPWIPAVRGRTLYYLDMFYGNSAYGDMEFYLMNLAIPMYNASGWDVSENDNHLDRYTRITVIGEACYRGYKPCIDKARSLFSQFMKNPDRNPIHPDLRPVVYCVGVAQGGIREWDFLRSLYQKDYGDVYIAYENSTVQSALSCARHPHVIRTMLDFALKYNSSTLFNGLAGSRHAKDTVWDYIMEKWPEFQVKNVSRISKSSLLKALSDNWNSDWNLKKLDMLVATHNTTGLNKTIDEVRKMTKKNMKWVDDNMENIEAWLQSVNQVGSPGTSSRKKRSLRAMEEEIDSSIPFYEKTSFDSDLHRSNHIL